MSELLERLRRADPNIPIYKEVADAIERLEAALANMEDRALAAEQNQWHEQERAEVAERRVAELEARLASVDSLMAYEHGDATEMPTNWRDIAEAAIARHRARKAKAEEGERT